MTAYELEQLRYAWTAEDYYRDSVYANYTGKADSPILSALADELIGSYAGAEESFSISADTYAARHGAVMTVMRYLGETFETEEVDEEGNPVVVPRFTYTLNPTVPTDPSLDGVENFLTVTGEGYCVQFASAAVLLLRELGIPARYVEGYIVTDFHRSFSPDSGQRYAASVHDYHAHAWIEVYYDGIGWLNYEATPALMPDMYEEAGLTAERAPIRPWYLEEEEEEEDPVDEEELARLLAEAEERETRERLLRRAVTTAVVALVLAAVVVALVVLVRRARRADAVRAARISAAISARGNCRAVARILIDETTALLAAYGSAPQPGEQQKAYAARLTPDYGRLCTAMPLTDLFAAIAAEEFGFGMADDALAALADFRVALGQCARVRLPLWRRVWYRYIKHLL